MENNWFKIKNGLIVDGEISASSITASVYGISDLVVNVKQFGAVGNGIADDLNAFKNAISYINSNGGGTLYVPSGSFLLDVIHTGSYQHTKSINLCSNLHLILSPNTLILAKTSSLAAPKYAMMTINPSGLYPGASNIIIDGNGATMRGVRSGSANDPVLMIPLFLSDPNCSNVTVKNLNVDQAGTCGYFSINSASIENCKFSNAENNNVACTNGKYIKFKNCTFYYAHTDISGGSAVKAGIDLEPNSGETVDDITIEDCTFTNNVGNALYCQSGQGTLGRLRIINNRFFNNSSSAVIISTNTNKECIVTGNYFYNNGMSQVSNTSNILLSGPKNALITNNIIVGTVTGSFGIRATFVEDCIITDNKLVNCGGNSSFTNQQSAIQFASGKNCLVANNQINNCEGAGVLIQYSSFMDLVDNSIVNTGMAAIKMRDSCHNIKIANNSFAQNAQTGDVGVIEFISGHVANNINIENNKFADIVTYTSGITGDYTAGASTSSLYLDQYAIPQNNFYSGSWILVGTEKLLITNYTGSNKRAVLSSSFISSPTSGSSTYTITSNIIPTYGIVSYNENKKVDIVNNDFTKCSSIPIYSAINGTFENVVWNSETTKTVSSNYTASLYDKNIFVNTSTGNVTILLPTAVNQRCQGKQYCFKKVDSGTGSMVIDAFGSETIDGALVHSTNFPNGTVSVIASGSFWITTGNSQSSSYSLTSSYAKTASILDTKYVKQVWSGTNTGVGGTLSEPTVYLNDNITLTSVTASLNANDVSVGTLAVARGGTGISSYAVNDLIYASNTTTLSKLNSPPSGVNNIGFFHYKSNDTLAWTWASLPSVGYVKIPNYDSTGAVYLSDSLGILTSLTADNVFVYTKLTLQGPLVLYTATSNPSSPDTGTCYFNTSDNTLRIYNGSAWKSSSFA